MTSAKANGMPAATHATMRDVGSPAEALAKSAPARAAAGTVTRPGRNRSVLKTKTLGDVFQRPPSVFVGSSRSGGSRRSTRMIFVAKTCDEVGLFRRRFCCLFFASGGNRGPA